MKFILAPILILLLFIQTFNTLFVVISFNVNRDYISRNLCENRYRPAMKCNGNCVLAKKLKQQEKQEENNQAPVKVQVSTIVLSSKSFFASFENPDFYNHQIFCTIKDSGKPIDRSFAFFHPPSI